MAKYDKVSKEKYLQMEEKDNKARKNELEKEEIISIEIQVLQDATKTAKDRNHYKT